MAAYGGGMGRRREAVSDVVGSGGAMDQVAEFRILGPLEIRVGSTSVLVTARREALALAALLFHAGDIVVTDDLAAAVWGSRLPANPANQIAFCVSSLRRRLRAVGADGALIATRAPGYLLRDKHALLDTAIVDTHVSHAHEALANGRREEALWHLGEALGCWRGPILPAMRSKWLAPDILRWEERRTTLFEQRIQLALDLGRHNRVIGELSAMVADHSMREHLREQLMVALYRSGRRAEALGVYTVTRRLFRDELGIEPGSRLRRIRDAIHSGTLK